jgi:hypothetical protein
MRKTLVFLAGMFVGSVMVEATHCNPPGLNFASVRGGVARAVAQTIVTGRLAVGAVASLLQSVAGQTATSPAKKVKYEQI